MLEDFPLDRPRNFSRRLFFIFPLIFAQFLFADNANSRSEEDGISGYLDWTEMEMRSEVQIDLKALGLALPEGRGLAEDRLFDEYFSKVRLYLRSIPVDSSSVLGDLISRGDLHPEIADDLARSAVYTHPAFSRDMRKMRTRYNMSLSSICSKLLKHNKTSDFLHIVDPPDVPSYTGIIIIADETLPIRGKTTRAELQPCLFPKVWDSEMNLVFDVKHCDPAVFSRHETMVNYFPMDSILKRNPSGLSPEVEEIVGKHPLRVLARGLFGITPTDIVIDAADAVQMLSSESNRNLLRYGRLVIITPDSALKTIYK